MQRKKNILYNIIYIKYMNNVAHFISLHYLL
nr:MAG TPA: hypothetical protein [Caudoviricetes sp.]